MGLKDLFLRPMPLTYNPYPNTIQADTNSTVHSNDVYLDDIVYPDAVAHSQSASMLGDSQPQPSYDDAVSGPIEREIIFTPGLQHGYRFAQAEQGTASIGKSTTQDVGGIPGTVYENVFHGPVTGSAMDEWQVGARTQLESLPPGYTGPVTGSPDADYATQLAYATYQQQLADYSAAVATDAMVAAV